eukprot:2320516-Rhodomonas_salina.1
MSPVDSRPQVGMGLGRLSLIQPGCVVGGCSGEFVGSEASAMGTNWTVEAGNECFLLAAAWNSATEALTLRVIS